MAALEPKDNGDAKGTIQKVPALRELLRPRRKEDKKSIFDEFLNSNKNNPTKSRIPHPAGMAVYQSLGLWSLTKAHFRYEVQGEVKTFPKTVAGFHDCFKRLYDEDAISFGGKSREEGMTAALGFFLQDIEDITQAKQSRLGEAGGAARSK